MSDSQSESDSQSDPQPDSRSEPQKIRVVLVDDNHIVTAALQSAIDAAGDLVTVGVAHDGPTGVALCRQRLPDVAVLDISMPGGGPEMVRTLAEMLPGTHLLAYSGQPEDMLVLEMLDAGTISYVAKGTPLAELLRAIRRAAEGKMTVSESVAPLISSWLYEKQHRT